MSGFESAIIDLIRLLGFPIVLLILFSKGILIGKPLPAIATISTYALLVNSTVFKEVLFITVVTAAATTFGELLIFDQTRRQKDYLTKYIPKRMRKMMVHDSDNKRFSRVTGWFSNHVGATVFIVNLTTGIRGFASIPAGKKMYPYHRFILVSYFSTLLYHTILTYAVVSGISLVL